ncbi:MAG: PAS domain S-box protein [Anaerolineales bacterium]|nr:PAS domain S-box protein [Anaerolineales bacterium]
MNLVNRRMLSTESITPSLPVTNQDVLQVMVESAPVAIVAVDGNGDIIMANSKLAEMFGYSPEELLAKPIELLLPERFRSGHRLYRDEYAVSPRVRPMGSGLDLSGRRKDGSEFPVEIGLSYLQRNDTLIVMSSVADITRRKQTEEILERRVRERTHELERRRLVSDSLRDTLAILNSNRPLQEILNHIVEQASQLLRADAGAIYQISDHDASLLIAESAGLTVHSINGMSQPRLFPPRPQAVNGNKSMPRNGTAPVDAEESENQYCAQLAVPLKIKDEVYGGLLLYYLEPRKFSNEEIELANTLGDHAVLAIENARLRARAEQTAVAAERNRIARDLHDSVTQTLFSATLIAEVLPRLVQRDSVEGAKRLEELRQLTRGALAEMRTLLLELRPATLVEVGIEELLRQLIEAARGRARIPIDVTMEITAPLQPDVKVAFYYIAQEALNNVAKHARAHHVIVRLDSRPDCAELVVSDDGAGFDAATVSAEHLGLAIMQERTDAVAGKLEISSTPGHGTQIAVFWSNPEQAP